MCHTARFEKAARRGDGGGVEYKVFKGQELKHCHRASFVEVES